MGTQRVLRRHRVAQSFSIFLCDLRIISVNLGVINSHRQKYRQTHRLHPDQTTGRWVG